MAKWRGLRGIWTLRAAAKTRKIGTSIELRSPVRGIQAITTRFSAQDWDILSMWLHLFTDSCRLCKRCYFAAAPVPPMAGRLDRDVYLKKYHERSCILHFLVHSN
jgi:hypothetical protein